MAAKVQVVMPDGKKEYFVYNDNREVEQDFQAGSIVAGDQVVYRGLICDVYCDFEDHDGDRFVEMLVVGQLGPQFSYSVCR